ncbi:MAG: hypothetical protein AAF656_06975 [Planctomycetota bacterium]
MVISAEHKIFLDADPVLRERWLGLIVEEGRLLLELDNQLYLPDSDETVALEIQAAWKRYARTVQEVLDVPVQHPDELVELLAVATTRASIDLRLKRKEVREVLDGTNPGLTREEIRRELLVQAD